MRGGGITEEYLEANKKVKNMIRNAKRRFEKKLADGEGGNKRPFFAYIKRKTKSRPRIGPLKDKDKKVVTEDEEMAKILNDFFSSVFTREDLNQIPEAEEMETDTLEEIRITAWKVRKKIRKLSRAAASGPDGIGPCILQELENELVEGLTLIFQRSIYAGVVPEDWRTANVTPIFKKGSKSDPGNYRPVSLTSVCCKLLESILRDEMMRHLEMNKLIRQSQHGFMPRKSCGTNLLEFLERVTRAVDEGKPYDVIFLDFAKAFDVVQRARLLEKLKAHGIRGKLLVWIKNWLSGRKQRVVLNGKCSSWMEVLSGVPQGSVLGPILFLIYINDLDGATESIDVMRKFADDTKLGHTVSSAKDREELQRTLKKLGEWATRWGMSFNVKKCKVMHVGHNNQKFPYTMNGEQLEVTEVEKDIGVDMSNTLKPSMQCRNSFVKLNQSKNGPDCVEPVIKGLSL